MDCGKTLLRETCIANGTVDTGPIRKTRTYQGPSQVETQLRGVYNVGKDVSYTQKPTIKDIEPGERFKTEDTTLISLLGLLLGNCLTLIMQITECTMFSLRDKTQELL